MLTDVRNEVGNSLGKSQVLQIFTVIHWRVSARTCPKKSDCVLVEAWIFRCKMLCWCLRNVQGTSAHYRVQEMHPYLQHYQEILEDHIFPLMENIYMWSVA